MAEAESKRPGGRLNAAGNWLVLDGESEALAEGGYRHRCGTIVLSQKVYHPVWDGPFPLSGSGQVHMEQVPYCPTCETEPNRLGSPIETGDYPSRNRR